MIKITLFVLLVFSLMLAACAPTVSNAETMMDKPTEVMMEKSTETKAEAPTETMMEKTPETMMEDASESTIEKTPEAMMEAHTPTSDAMGSEMNTTPAWFSAVLNNVNTGEDFTINDYAGKVVLVETLAMWCPSCKRQQMQVKALHEALGMDTDLVSIGLDIDPNENANDLRAYTASNDFDWIYAVAPSEVAREIGQLYGDQFLNPSSTPILIIDRKGQAHPMPFGVKSADDLMKFIEPLLIEGM